jgi:phosphatidylinositol alpha-mannosyltransferase
LRICHVTAAYYPYPSGVSEYVHHLAGALRARGHHVHILTTNYGPNSPALPDVTRLGRAYLVPMNRSYATVPLGWHMSGDVRRFLTDNLFDVLHLHGVFPPDISYWALRHSQAVNVVTFHTVGFATSRAAAWLCRHVFARINRRLHGRIAVTLGAREFIRPYFPGDYRIIREGIDTQRFSPELSPIDRSRVPGPMILFVGRLDARKGLPVLLRAVPIVLRKVPGVQLVVVGKGPLEAEARALCGRLNITGRVHFQGFVPNELLPRYYVSGDVYCAPTLGGEAFGIVLLEAMASGVPVVASDITGYNEVIRNEETGVLCRAGDPTLLAASLIRVLTDEELRTRLRSAGRAWAEYHDWTRVAAEIEDYYVNLLEREACDT